MSGRKAGQKAFDWIKISSRVPQEARASFNSFRSRHEVNKANLAAYPEKPEPINWGYYRKTITVSGLVDKFEKAFSGVSIPYPKDSGSAEIESKKKEIEAQVAVAIADAKKKITELQKELNTVNAEKPYEDMTIDEYLSDKPTLRKQIEDDTRNHVWYLGRD